jgi:primosomal protein N' (replication factor Y)
MDPDHYALVRAAAHDYEGFYADEIPSREDAGYPPFSRLAMVSLSCTAEQPVEHAANEAARMLRELRRVMNARIEILGPAPAPLAKVRGRFRWQILLKSANRTDMKKVLVTFRSQWNPSRIIRTNVDIDPVDTL